VENREFASWDEAKESVKDHTAPRAGGCKKIAAGGIQFSAPKRNKVNTFVDLQKRRSLGACSSAACGFISLFKPGANVESL
jgi:hypothetical protein